MFNNDRPPSRTSAHQACKMRTSCADHSWTTCEFCMQQPQIESASRAHQAWVSCASSAKELRMKCRWFVKVVQMVHAWFAKEEQKIRKSSVHRLHFTRTTSMLPAQMNQKWPSRLSFLWIFEILCVFTEISIFGPTCIVIVPRAPALR